MSEAIGRGWLLTEVGAALLRGGRGVALTGPAGIGKTTFCRSLTDSIRFAATHYCDTRNLLTANPLLFAVSLCKQLRSSVDRYDEALVATGRPLLSLMIRQDVAVNYGSVRGVVVEELKLGFTSADTAFDALVVNPLQWLSSASALAEPITILVDGLDATDQHTGSPSIRQLIAFSARMPVRWVVTSRTDDGLLPDLERIELKPDDARNRDDVRRYIERSIVGIPGASDWAARLNERARGNFLIAELSLRAVDHGALTLPDLEQLGSTLVDALRSEFGRLARKYGDRLRDRSFRAVLAALAMAFEPIDVAEIEELVAIEAEEANQQLHILHPLVIEHDVGGTLRYQFFHDSVKEFLGDQRDSGDLWIDLQARHRRYALTVAALRTPWTSRSSYQVSRYIDHMHACGLDVSTAVRDVDWMNALLQRRSVFALVERLALAPSEEITSIRAAIIESSQILMRDPGQLRQQLLARLQRDRAGVSEFCTALAASLPAGALAPRAPEAGVGFGDRTHKYTVTGEAVVAALNLGEYVIGATADGLVQLWQYESCQPVAQVRAVVAAPAIMRAYDETTVLIAGDGGEIAIIDVKYRVVRQIVRVGNGRIRDCGVAGTVVVGVDEAGLFELDLAAGAVRRVSDLPISIHDAAIALAPEARTCAILQSELLVTWNALTGEMWTSKERATDGLWNRAVSISSDGTRAATTFHDRIAIWDLEARSLIVSGYIGHFHNAQLRCDGRDVLHLVGLTGGGSGGNRPYQRLESFSLAGVSGAGLRGNRPYHHPESLSVSPAERLKRLRSIALGSAPVRTGAWHVSDRGVVACLDDGTVLVRSLESEARSRANVRALTPALDGTACAVGFGENKFALWDVVTNRSVASWNIDEESWYRSPGVGCWGVAFSDDGRYLVGSYGSGRLHIIDAHTKQSARRLDGHLSGGRLSGWQFDAVLAMCPLPGQPRICTATERGVIGIWDLETGTNVVMVQLPHANIRRLMTDRSGCLLWALSDDGKVAAYDPAKQIIHDFSVTWTAIAPISEGLCLVGDKSGAVQVIGPGIEPREWALVDGGVTSIASWKDDRAVLGTATGHIYAIEPSPSAAARCVAKLDSAINNVAVASLAPRGVAASAGSVYLIDLEGLRIASSFTIDVAISALSIDGAGRWIAIGDDAGGVHCVGIQGRSDSV